MNPHALAAGAPATTLRTVAWAWFVAGSGLLLLFPALRVSHATFGWLPFWLVIAPLIDLAWLHGPRLMAMPRALLVRARHRRRPPRRQARRRRASQRHLAWRAMLAWRSRTPLRIRRG